MIQLPILLPSAKDAERFVSILEQFPYSMDLVSGARSVDAKSIIGVLAISQRTDLCLVIHEVFSDISQELFNSLEPYVKGNLKELTLQTA